MKGLRLKPPSPLPQGPVTKVAFKVFSNQMRAYLEQDHVNYMFLPEGCYSEWGPKQEGRQITTLADEDPENRKLIQQNEAGRIDLHAEQQSLLLTRNAQLTKFVTLIAILCYYTEQDDIMQCSTSYGWIIDYLKQHYNLESRGEHFLDILDVVYTADMSYQTFFKQFRAGFIDNLRKRGDILAYKNDQELTQDETMSPTLQASIVLWALERIDGRLPKKVKKNYGHQMTGNQCLVSLQPTIFQNIGAMLNELDEAENALAARCQVSNECNTISPQYQFKQQSSSSRGRQFRPRGPQRIKRGQSNQNKVFCRICYHAGAAPSAYLSHSISKCHFLTKADRADLRNCEVQEVTPVDDRMAEYSAPGWDVPGDQEDNYDSDECEINDNSYLAFNESRQESPQTNCIIVPQLNFISPVPSQTIQVSYNGKNFPITLDSGATISFIRTDLATDLNIPIHPNTQLATLADRKTILSAVGEIDVPITFEGQQLRLKALVVDQLQSPCFGGTNFHVDNYIVADLPRNSITIRGKLVQLPQAYQTSSSQHLDSKRKCRSDNTLRCVQVKDQCTLLPGSTLKIPLQSPFNSDSIVITPTFQGVNPKLWPAKICSIVDECAIYKNEGSTIINSPKYAHFMPTPLGEPNCDLSPKTSMRAINLSQPTSVSELIKQIQINDKVLSTKQREKLDSIHREFASVFDSDLSDGYNHRMGHYEASFVFKQNTHPPPLKVWVPQYNRSCQELLQAKSDQLEEQGVLIDPAESNTNILHLSPIMIQQKGRAKHKKLQQCSLDEVRFISCLNVLNDSIKPVPSTSTSHTKILKFIGRWKHHIYADLHNSYFQIPIKQDLWGYMAVTTPFKGIKVLTRAGQGLLNSDVFLDQLMCRVLGDEMTEGIAEVARDDIQIGGNTIEELLANWKRVLGKLHLCNLKISPNKVRILLNDVEVYGVRITDGFVLPSPHRVNDLGNIRKEDIKTVKQLNSWRGLYKTLIGHIPHLSYYMDPFDKVTATKKSGDTVEWSPDLNVAFTRAMAQLETINKTYLPKPTDRLILKPDTAKINTCSGWVLCTSSATCK